MMDSESERDLEDQVNKVFEESGGSLLNDSDRGREIGHLMGQPFFVGRDGKVPINSGRDRVIITKVMPKFDLGRVLGTVGFKHKVNPDEAIVALTRHAIGDWGEMCKSDKDLNDEAVENGSRILSRYSTPAGYTFYIITEADRAVTTCLMVDEY